MCPGRFPSPTASRESTPIESIEALPDHHKVFATTPDRPFASNFTASESLRKRPRFADPQSEPILSRHGTQTSIPTFFSPTPNRHAADKRRVSDPLYNRPLNSLRDGNAIRKQRMQRRAISTPSRLFSSPSRSSNAPSPGISHGPAQNLASTSARVTDTKLHQKLLEPLLPSDCKGVLYVIKDSMKDPAQKKLGIKIGFTKRANYEERIKEHARKCRFKPDIIYVSQDLEQCRRAEDLVHIELEDRCRPWKCDAHKDKNGSPTLSTHREWFDVSETVAVEMVKKWENFMIRERLYGWGLCRRKLMPIWRHLLTTRTLCAPQIGLDDHEARHKQWTRILSPTSPLDYLSLATRLLLHTWSCSLTLIVRIGPVFTAFFWQTITITHSFVTLVLFRNTFAATAFAVVLACACCSVLLHPKLGLRKRLRVCIT